MSRQTKPLVYISGPYTIGVTDGHVRKACMVWESLRDEGLCTPVCPHWSFLQAVIWPLSHEQWIEYDLEILARCDAVLRLPGESKGAELECQYAQQNGIPVFLTLSQLNDHLRQLQYRSRGG